MRDLFKRLGTTGGAYAAGSVAQKFVAIALLPLYTRHVSSAEYGAVEVLLQTVFTIGLLVRFGAIEAMFRFYFTRDEPESRDAIVRSTGAFLATSSTVVSLLLLLGADPVSRFLLDQPDAALVRIAAAGLWLLIVAEWLMALFRVRERARAYLVAALANLGLTVAFTVWLVVIEDLGAEGLLIGNFAGTACVVVALAVVHRAHLVGRPGPGLLGRMLRFGGPVMAAELSLYAITVIDRVAIVRFVGLAEAGLYSIAIKLSQGVVLLSQGFYLAWSPLAYSIVDDERARTFYARVTTYLLLVGTVVLLVTSLEAPWIVRALAAPEFYEAHKAVPLVSLAVLIYAVYVPMTVALGRVNRTNVLIVATLTGLVVDVALVLVLVPSRGMVGAAIALAASFVAAIPVLYAYVRSLFPIPYEWRRLATICALGAAVYAVGVITTGETGIGAFAVRAALVPAFVVLLAATGFFVPDELRQLRRVAARVGMAS